MTTNIKTVAILGEMMGYAVRKPGGEYIAICCPWLDGTVNEGFYYNREWVDKDDPRRVLTHQDLSAAVSRSHRRGVLEKDIYKTTELVSQIQKKAGATEFTEQDARIMMLELFDDLPPGPPKEPELT
jgi:hypothetical protein